MKLRRIARWTLSVVFIVLLAFGIFLLDAARTKTTPGNSRGSISIDGRNRTYELHVPPALDPARPSPLVIALHGRLGNGYNTAKLTHFDSVANTHKFIVVYPDGLSRSWADGRGETPSDKNGVDDVKFISTLIDKLASQFAIDPNRIYVAGISNGGFMSQRLACELSERIAAVGVVAATMDQLHVDSCRPKRPVSIELLHGTADELVPEQGGSLGSRGMVLSVQATIDKWRALDHCGAPPERSQLPNLTTDGTSVRSEKYSGCADGTEVSLYTIEGGGHTWPGGWQYLPKILIGKTTHNLDGSETLWEFFSRNPLH